MEKNPAVMRNMTVAAGEQQGFATVRAARISAAYIRSGENPGETKHGDTTENVAGSMSYLTVLEVSAILTGIVRAAVINTVENALLRHINLARVSSAKTSEICSKNGGNQEGEKDGDPMGVVVLFLLFLMVHRVSVTLKVKIFVATVIRMEVVLQVTPMMTACVQTACTS